MIDFDDIDYEEFDENNNYYFVTIGTINNLYISNLKTKDGNTNLFDSRWTNGWEESQIRIASNEQVQEMKNGKRKVTVYKYNSYDNYRYEDFRLKYTELNIVNDD